METIYQDEIIYGLRSDIEVNHIDESHATNMEMQILFGPDRGWPGHAMRLMSIGKGGKTFDHAHKHPHWVYITEGTGIVTIDGKAFSAPKGSSVYIPPMTQHCLKNKGDGQFEFICCISVNKK